MISLQQNRTNITPTIAYQKKDLKEKTGISLTRLHELRTGQQQINLKQKNVNIQKYKQLTPLWTIKTMSNSQNKTNRETYRNRKVPSKHRRFQKKSTLIM